MIDGLSIPFFSFGRSIRSRTVSWTSRNGSGPDWLLGVLHIPGTHKVPSSTGEELQRDLEKGGEEWKNEGEPRPEVIHLHPPVDTCQVSQQFGMFLALSNGVWWLLGGWVRREHARPDSVPAGTKRRFFQSSFQ